MDQPGNLRTVTSYALAYLLWGVSVAASIMVGLLAQQALVQTVTLTALGAAKDPGSALHVGLQIRAGDAWSYMLMGLLLVMVLVFLEHWYRTAVPSGRLLSHFLLVTTIELGVLFLAHGVYYVVANRAGAMSWRSIYLPAIELAATALCAFLYSRQARQPAKRR